MEVDRALGWLQATPVAKAISENEILFPWIEFVHVRPSSVVGTISIVDLRLFGVASLDRAVSRLMHDAPPYTGRIRHPTITGLLMFSSMPWTDAHNFFFRGGLSCSRWQVLTWPSFTSWAFATLRVGATPSNTATRQDGRRRIAACVDRQWWRLVAGLASQCTETTLF